MRYVLRLTASESRFVVVSYGGGAYATEWEIAPGGEAICPDLATAEAMVASGAWAWVEGRPPVEAE